jgi:hypothetical protein
MAITESEFLQAETRMQELREIGHAVSARYDRRTSRIIVKLNTGLELGFPPSMAEGLANAEDGELADIEISPSGLGLHWPRLDADLYIPALLQGVFGSRQWIAAPLGAAGGRARTPAKTVSSRANGRKGGRPRKAGIG